MKNVSWVGGILLTKSQSWISKLISWGESLDSQDKFEPSHVAILESASWIWEATIGGVQRSPLNKYVGPEHTSYVALYQEFSTADRLKIVSKAKSFAGKEYGYIDLPIHFADILLSKAGLKRRTLSRLLNLTWFIICSELVGLAYGRGVHYRFHDKEGKWLRPSVLRPDDIWRHVSKSPKWIIVRI